VRLLLGREAASAGMRERRFGLCPAAELHAVVEAARSAIIIEAVER